MRQAPFDMGKDSLFVAYYASAEINCFLVLGWSLPIHILDLFTEFRCMTNGLPTIGGSRLYSARCSMTVYQALSPWKRIQCATCYARWP